MLFRLLYLLVVSVFGWLVLLTCYPLAFDCIAS